jgi:hypothetical protein
MVAAGARVDQQPQGLPVLLLLISCRVLAAEAAENLLRVAETEGLEVVAPVPAVAAEAGLLLALVAWVAQATAVSTLFKD